MVEQAEYFAYLLSFSRRDKAAWLAHLDLMRVMERSLRRALIPLRWSQGFNPRPSLVFALPLGMGLECDHDLLEIETMKPVDPDVLVSALNASLPSGLEVHDAQPMPQHKQSIMSLVQEAVYLFEGQGLGDAFEKLASSEDKVWVKREHKGKIRELDLFELIVNHCRVSPDAFRIRCRAGSSSNLRPDLCLTALTDAGLITQDAADDARILREGLILDALPDKNFDAVFKPVL